MTLDRLRQQISEFLGFSISETPVPFITHNAVEEHGYSRIRISYTSQEGDQIPAFLLLPDGDGPFAAVLVHHQHNSQRHLGKSEVCGLVGDSLQAFGPTLVRQGMVVLAPDSICFEDRRRNRTGTEADEAADVEQHYNEMCYRLLRGDTLMRQMQPTIQTEILEQPITLTRIVPAARMLPALDMLRLIRILAEELEVAKGIFRVW